MLLYETGRALKASELEKLLKYPEILTNCVETVKISSWMLHKESRRIDENRGGISNCPRGNTKVENHPAVHGKIEENC